MGTILIIQSRVNKFSSHSLGLYEQSLHNQGKKAFKSHLHIHQMFIVYLPSAWHASRCIEYSTDKKDRNSCLHGTCILSEKKKFRQKESNFRCHMLCSVFSKTKGFHSYTTCGICPQEMSTYVQEFGTVKFPEMCS